MGKEMEVSKGQLKGTFSQIVDMHSH
jgi:hypothetical protein